MKAMVLAAGLGTRLRPLTDRCPKALVKLGGRTLLEITLDRLRDAGVDQVIVNVHHMADRIVEFLSSMQMGMRIEISREDALLDTGGGLKFASWFFLDEDVTDDEPFFLHNVDVVSTIDLGRMLEAHRESDALVTLGVQRRASSRYLLFDERGDLCGWRSKATGETRIAAGVETAEELAFSGIHVISPRLLPMIDGEGRFSIIDTYLKLATAELPGGAVGRRIRAFRTDAYYWKDLGTPESLAQAARDLKA